MINILYEYCESLYKAIKPVAPWIIRRAPPIIDVIQSQVSIHPFHMIQ